MFVPVGCTSPEYPKKVMLFQENKITFFANSGKRRSLRRYSYGKALTVAKIALSLSLSGLVTTHLIYTNVERKERALNTLKPPLKVV